MGAKSAAIKGEGATAGADEEESVEQEGHEEHNTSQSSWQIAKSDPPAQKGAPLTVAGDDGTTGATCGVTATSPPQEGAKPPADHWRGGRGGGWKAWKRWTLISPRPASRSSRQMRWAKAYPLRHL